MTSKITVQKHGRTEASGGLSIPLEEDPFAKVATGIGDAGPKSVSEDNEITNYTLYKVVEPPFNLGNLARLYEKSPSQMAAVDAKVSGIVGQGFKFMESRKTLNYVDDIESPDMKERERRKVEELREMLRDVLEIMNGVDQFVETLQSVVTDLESTGNGYLEIGRNLDGSVGYIGHVTSKTVRVRGNRDGFVQIVGTKATFFRNYGTDDADDINQDSNPNEIIHIKHTTPNNSYYGLPKVVSAIAAVAGEIFATEYNLDFFRHKAVPRHMIIVKNAALGEEAERDIDQFMQTNFKGEHHRTMVVQLPEKSGEDAGDPEIEVVPIGPSKNESSFELYKSSNKSEILMANRVPESIVGQVGASSLGATRDSTRIFKEQVCRPAQLMLESKLGPVFKEITDMFEFKLNELTLTDEETMARINERYLRWEVYTPNDVLVSLGERRRDGGDETVGVMAQADARTKQSTDEAVSSNEARERDQERSGGPDTVGSDRTRGPKGEGRQTG